MWYLTLKSIELCVKFIEVPKTCSPVYILCSACTFDTGNTVTMTDYQGLHPTEDKCYGHSHNHTTAISPGECYGADSYQCTVPVPVLTPVKRPRTRAPGAAPVAAGRPPAPGPAPTLAPVAAPVATPGPPTPVVLGLMVTQVSQWHPHR